jgi:hypothetical protein
VAVEGFRWLDWDGTTRWWGGVRNVWLRSLRGWNVLQDWCLRSWETDPLIVIRQCDDGGGLVFFCETSAAAADIRKCPSCELPQYGPPWVQLIPSWESLYFSFEEANDSPARKAFVLACLRENGPFRIQFDP